MQNPSMTMSSTAGISENDRACNKWTGYLATNIDVFPDQHKSSEHVLCEPIGGSAFTGELESGNLGFLKLNRVKTSPHRFRRKINASVSHSSNPLILMMQLSGVSKLNTTNYSGYLEPGSMVVFDTRYSFDVSNIEHTDQILVTIPRNNVSIAEGAINTCGHRFDNQDSLSKLLSDILLQSVNSYDLLNSASRISIGHSILHLIPNILSSADRGDETFSCATGTVVQRIKYYIEQHMADPCLTIKKIAEENNCSERTIHRIFKMTDAGSVSHYIWNRRITSAASILTDPGYIDKSITDIAFSCGFSSSAHFSRIFKDFYGMAPREYRNSISLLNS